MEITISDWAEAISARLSDEWVGNNDFQEDSVLLKDVLKVILVAFPDECMRLVGTGIIEETYFEPLD